MSINPLSLAELTSNEEKALQAYKQAYESSGVSHCFTMNQELRAGLRLDEMSTGLAKTVENLDRIFSRTPRLMAPLTVYRGTGNRSFLQVAEAGFRFRANEFWSTSRREDLVEKFIGLGGALLELHLTEGVPAYDMETLAGAGGHEQEILLPRGVLWEVTSVRSSELPILLKGKYKCEHHSVARITLKALKFKGAETYETISSLL